MPEGVDARKVEAFFWSGGLWSLGPKDFHNRPTISSGFSLDTTSPSKQNPHRVLRGPAAIRQAFRREGTKCNTYLAGRYSVSTPIAKHAATGCAPTPCRRTPAAIAARRCTTFRHRWARGCGCVRARWADRGCDCARARASFLSAFRSILCTLRRPPTNLTCPRKRRRGFKRRRRWRVGDRDSFVQETASAVPRGVETLYFD
jgi:hypothetical protein